MSTETKPAHTPGPRTIKVFAYGSQILVLGPDKGDGERDIVGSFTGPRRLEDAVLDVAAPNLLAACEDLLADLSMVEEWDAPEAAEETLGEILDKHYDRIEAVVAKAKGKPGARPGARHQNPPDPVDVSQTERGSKS